MEKIITSQEAARETIKTKLRNEIPKINDVIKEAMSTGQHSTKWAGALSNATIIMLEKAGYYVDNTGKYGVYAEISWDSTYDEIVGNTSELEKIVEKLKIGVVKVQ